MVALGKYNENGLDLRAGSSKGIKTDYGVFETDFIQKIEIFILYHALHYPRLSHEQSIPLLPGFKTH